MIVVTAWREGAPPRLAARITYTVDTLHAARVTVTTSGEDEIATVFGRWLNEVVAAAGRRDAPVTDE